MSKCPLITLLVNGIIVTVTPIGLRNLGWKFYIVCKLSRKHGNPHRMKKGEELMRDKLSHRGRHQCLLLPIRVLPLS
jgi:hypothetical protein